MATGDVKLKYGPVTAMTVTNLHSLASSNTLGWQSQVVDNSTDLYEDAHVQVIVDFAATLPANAKALRLYAYSGLETSYSNPVSGAQGTITLLDVLANAQNIMKLGNISYTTTDEIVKSSTFSVAAGFGGLLPVKWGLVIMNLSGAAIAAAGNTVKWMGVYRAVTP